MKGEYTYQKAYDELHKIVSEIEQEKIQLDQLAAKMQKATELIAYCKAKLRAAEDSFTEASRKIDE